MYGNFTDQYLSLQGNQVLSALHELSAAHRRLEINNSNMVSTLKAEVLSYLRDHSVTNAAKSSESAPYDDISAQSFQGNLETLAQLVKSLVHQASRLSYESKTIESLLFEELDARRAQIAEASPQTFGWIFEDDSGFVRWLRSSHDIYWVTGKPGSGKSTLMKYLCEQEQVRRNLQAWTQDKPLIIANFFFWHSGTAIQKSQHGLFQTLLYNIFRQCPNLIAELVPDRCPTGESWTRDQLMKVFLSLRDRPPNNTRFCIFIDGLDEYEGDHREVIRIINDMAQSGIKICFSSRPWNVFEEAYADNAGFKLHVHDHTSHDIANFVNEQFGQDERFLRLRHINSGYQDLVDEIISRANGVFLWVFLVVRSLSRGLTNEDTIEDFQRRLRAIPTDLKTYFKLMLQSTEDVYQSQAARIYLMCLNSPGPLWITPLSFFAEEDYSHFGAQLCIPKVYSERQEEKDAQIAIRRIKARCPDLLEIKYSDRPDNWQVQFLHRTAHDFIATEDVLKYLTSLEPNFEVHDHLCHAYILTTKLFLLHEARISSEITRFSLYQVADLFLFHTKFLENRSYIKDQLIEEMAQAMSSNRFSNLSKPEAVHILMSMAIEQGEGHHLFLKRNRNIFQSLVQLEVDKSFGAAPPLLAKALCPSDKDFMFQGHDPSKHGQQSPDVDTVKLLLEAGADPNKIHKGPIWLYFIGKCLRECLYEPPFPLESQRTSQLLEMLILWGADVPQRFNVDNRPFTLPRLISKICLPRDAEPLLDLINQRKQTGKPRWGLVVQHRRLGLRTQLRALMSFSKARK